MRRDFPRVLERAAQIVGVGPDIDHKELERIRAEHRVARVARDRRAAEERARGEAMVPALWEALDRRHIRGERRGLDPAVLRACGDVVRFRRDGSPAVQLRSFATGAPANIAYRQLAGEPKVITLSLESVLGIDDLLGGFSTAGTLVGHVGDLDTSGVGPDVAVLAEGMTDTLAGVLAFPGCVVVGASGADRLPHVAAAIAPRLVEARGWLLVVPHVDGGKGEQCAADAVIAAERVGLKLDESIHLGDVRPHKDLADAWRDGWRWRWL